MKSLYQEMAMWYKTELGSMLLDLEAAEINKIISSHHGSFFLQLGGSVELLARLKNSIRYKFQLNAGNSATITGISAQGVFNNLPFLKDSIDIVVASHILEFSNDPKSILNELYEILKGEGLLIILGFNPYSLWGIYKWGRGRNKVPWCGKFWSSWRLRLWLHRLGFIVEDYHTLFFRPPLADKNTLKKLIIWETLGRLLWSNSGGIYLMVVKKRQNAFIPLSATNYRPKLAADNMELRPHARTQDHD